MLLGPVGLGAKMPLADGRGCIPRFAQPRGDRDLLERQVVEVRRGEELALAATLEVVRQADSGGVPPRQDAGARGRAYGARSIGVREEHAFAGQRVYGRSLVEPAAVAPRIPLAKVVHQDEDDIHGSAPPYPGPRAAERTAQAGHAGCEALPAADRRRLSGSAGLLPRPVTGDRRWGRDRRTLAAHMVCLFHGPIVAIRARQCKRAARREPRCLT